MLRVGSQKVDNIWVPQASEKKKQFCLGFFILSERLKLFANKAYGL
jgi:hypothetical protein